MSINLQKGQKIDLQKGDGSSLQRVFMGLGWDPVNSKGAGGILRDIFGGSSSSGGNIDLDASCVMLDANKSEVDVVYFGKLYSTDGSVRHSGDNLTGAGDGDDEVINVDLQTVPERVQTIVFVINSFQGQTFNEVDNCFARLVDTNSNQEIAIYKLKEHGDHNAMIMCKLYRHNGAWKMAAIGAPASGRTVRDLLPTIKNVI